MVQGKGVQSAYLSSYARDEALRVVVDAYRLRVETDHLSREEDHGIYYPGKPIDGLVWVKGGGESHISRIAENCRNQHCVVNVHTDLVL